MNDYEEKMLLLLVEKYRKSKKDSGTGRINRRTQIKPIELYRGYNRNDGDLEQINACSIWKLYWHTHFCPSRWYGFLRL